MNKAAPLQTITTAAIRIAHNLPTDLRNDYFEFRQYEVSETYPQFSSNIALDKMSKAYGNTTLARIYDATPNLPDYRELTRDLANGAWATGRGMSTKAAKAHIVSITVRDAILATFEEAKVA